MAKATVQSLTKQADKLHRQYQAYFAGESRHTRDVDRIERLVDKLQSVRRKVAKLHAKGARELEAKVAERLDLYTTERDLIAEASLQGPAIAELGLLQGALDRVMGRYHRHFGGRARATRELAALREGIVDLETLREHTLGLARETVGLDVTRQLEAIDARHKILTDEEGAIVGALLNLSATDRWRALATQAANVIGLYQRHFQGMPRHTRRPGLLARLIESLSEVREGLGTLPAPDDVGDEAAAKQLDTIDKDLALFQTELGAVETLRAETSDADLVGLLGTAANAEIERYRESFAGQSRSTRDLGLLLGICDRLDEIERQMVSLSLRSPSDPNTRNLSVVRNVLKTYDAETPQIAEAIKAAQAERGTGAGLEKLVKVKD